RMSMALLSNLPATARAGQASATAIPTARNQGGSSAVATTAKPAADANSAASARSSTTVSAWAVGAEDAATITSGTTLVTSSNATNTATAGFSHRFELRESANATNGASAIMPRICSATITDRLVL